MAWIVRKFISRVEAGLPSIFTERHPVWKGKSDVTLPPFSPNRILKQWHFLIQSDGTSLILQPKKLHPEDQKRSSENLCSNVLSICPCGLLIWFSSKTRSNGRGSILVYHTRDDKVFTWYVALERQKKWLVSKTKNIDTEAVRRVFSNY